MRSAANCRYDRYLGAVRDCRRQTFEIAYVFVANEDIDMFAHFALFVREAIAESGIPRPEYLENLAQRAVNSLDLNSAQSVGINAQRTWNVKDDCHYLPT